MIMPCINSTSFGECGGKLARVEGGNVFVGWPGAPGWTTTGLDDPDCAAIDTDNKQTNAHTEASSVSHERNLGQGPS